MAISWWNALSSLAAVASRNGRPRTAPNKPRRPRLFLEALEDRCVPTTFNVNTLADLSIAAGVNADGTIGMTSIVTLRSAVQAANNTPGNNTINLTVAGDYKLTLVGTPGETDNLAGELAILPTGGALIIQNTSGGGATIDGNNAVRDLDINPGNTDNPATKGTVTIAGVTITNGIAQPGDFAAGSGGGIRDQGNISLTLNNDVITNNYATADGGGVSMENSPASTPWTLTLNNTIVSDNHAGDAGGGVETDGKGKVIINGGQITGNSTVNQGGGVWLDATADGVASVTITNPGTGYTAAPTVTFSAPQNAGGTTATGVAIINGDNAVASVTITNPGSGYTAAPTVTFSPPPAGVTATGTANLGFDNSASLAITGTLINDNSAYMVDGGIGNAGNGAVTITDSTIENNFSAGAGGGFGDQNNLGSLTVTGSYFLNNSAVGDGGGIQEGGPSTTITDTEIKGNSSNASGGGLFANGPALTILNCTIAANTAAVGGGGIELETTQTLPGSTITNTTIVGNRVLNNGQNGNGGGIDAPAAFTGRVQLINDTINGNFADNGGGFFWTGMGGTFFLLQNTIVAQNSASVAGPDADIPTVGFRDLGGNLIGNNSGFLVDGFGLDPTTQEGTPATPLNPQLGPLTNNLGPLVGAPGSSIVLETEAINGSSVAFDKGVVNALTTDERGFTRTDAGANEKPDVGAFEFQDAIVAAEVPGAGVFLYTQATGTFAPLTPANATVLAANASGQVAAEFPGYGVDLYSNGVWTSLTSFNATLLGIDAAGDVFAKIPGYDLQVNRGGVWTLLPGNTVSATLLAVDARGDVATEIPGYGVFFLPNGGTNFMLLTPANASVLAIDNNGDVFADLAGAGVFRYSNGAWTQLTTQNATMLSADALGDVAADFAGYGVFRFTAATNAWTQLGTPDAGALSMDDGGDIFASFPGQGVMEYTFANGVVQVTTQHASILSAS